jgi:hypothetical protein
MNDQEKVPTIWQAPGVTSCGRAAATTLAILSTAPRFNSSATPTDRSRNAGQSSNYENEI